RIAKVNREDYNWNSTYTFSQTVRSVSYQESTAIADFDEDNQSDLVLENNRTGERVIWQMNGAEIAGLIRAADLHLRLAFCRGQATSTVMVARTSCCRTR
ncbi:MAG: hypothetical protein QM760_03890, partial [Nibricoccus sp.]